MNAFRKHYFQGSYDKNCQLVAKASSENCAYVLGSYYMLDQREEAEALWKKIKKTDHRAFIKASSFRGMYLVRKGEHKEGLALFLDSFRIWRQKGRQADLGFYVYQSFAFFRYYSGLFNKALRFALRSLESCQDSDSHYEKIYALELIAHIYVQRGLTQRGLLFFEQAKDLSSKLECNELKTSIEITCLGYQVQHGIELENSLKQLEVAQGMSREFYMNSHICLQIAKGCYLKGDISAMKNKLEEASYFIYETQNQRHMVQLNISLAITSCLEKNYPQAFLYFQNAKNYSSNVNSTLLEIKVLGLELSLLKQINPSSDKILGIKKKIITLSQSSHNFLPHVYLDRYKMAPLKVDLKEVYDPIYLLLKNQDFSRFPSADFVKELSDRNLLGLLNLFQSVQKNKTILWFSLRKNKVLIVHSGNVRWSTPKVTKGLFDFIKMLCQNRRVSKRLMVEKFWGLDYKDYMHDALVYNYLYRLRKADPLLTSVIHLEKYIELDSSVKVRGLNKPIKLKMHKKPLKDVSDFSKSYNLNHRQISLLESMNEGDSIVPADYATHYEVSRITATRDLTSLVQKQFLRPQGKTRSTRYIRTTHLL